MKLSTIAVSVPFLLLLGACEQQKPPQQQQPAPAQVQGGVQFTYGKLSETKASDGAGGTGCRTDSGPLPDGAWFGYIMAWGPSGISFDPACIYDGEAAAKIAAAKGQEPPDDFIIVNDSKAVRQISVPATAVALRVTNAVDGSIDNQTTTFGDLVANPGTYTQCPGDGCTVWVFVNAGVVTEVAQQYFP
jgi:hypothetical protein